MMTHEELMDCVATEAAEQAGTDRRPPILPCISRLDTLVDESHETKLIALDGGQIFVGSVGLLYRDRVSACIRQLFVDPECRRRGVGRALVAEACGIAKKGGCETMGLTIGAANRGLFEDFYRPLGFIFAYEFDDGSAILAKQL